MLLNYVLRDSGDGSSHMLVFSSTEKAEAYCEQDGGCYVGDGALSKNFEVVNEKLEPLFGFDDDQLA